eukprot:1401995-Alexandrium_andersonii.AAC.1
MPDRVLHIRGTILPASRRRGRGAPAGGGPMPALALAIPTAPRLHGGRRGPALAASMSTPPVA